MASTSGSLDAAYEGLVCDLDGVVYRGSQPLPYAVSSLSAATLARRVCFATNNASRTPEQICEQLRALGLAVDPERVLTSAQAGADLLAGGAPPTGPVLAVGGPGVACALRAVGLEVTEDPDQARAVLQGWGREVRVADLAAAALAVRAGARWVATNTDRTLPVPGGLVPGNGTLVSAVAEASGRQPEVVGKPHPPLFRAAARRLASRSERLLHIGDRLDTDVLGADRVGADSLWVLGGVDGFAQLLRSPARPTYAAGDLRVLLEEPPAARVEGAVVSCRDARVAGTATGLRLTVGGRPALMTELPANTVAALGLALILQHRDDPETDVTPVDRWAAELDDVLPHCAGEAGRQ